MSETRVNIGAYQTRFNGRMGTFKRGVLLKLFASVVKDTPVLTGRLRANWVFTKGEPSQLEGTNSLTGDPMPAIISGVNAEVDEKDGSVFLTNSMPYCNRIEYEGYSREKSPEGMVRKNIVRIASNLAKQKGESKQ